MTKILDTSGKPVMHVATEAKKAHDPAELQRQRIRISNILRQLMQEFITDITHQGDTPEVLKPDTRAVVEHYDQKWREQARVINESSLPLTVDADVLEREMTQVIAQRELQRQASLPLHKIPDLAAYHLLPLVHSQRGMLYLNSRVCVAIDAEGNTTVWLRLPHEPLEMWCSGWVPQPWREPIVEALDYTLGEINNLMAITRRPDVSSLNERWMSMARTPEASTARKPWYRFW